MLIIKNNEFGVLNNTVLDSGVHINIGEKDDNIQLYTKEPLPMTFSLEFALGIIYFKMFFTLIIKINTPDLFIKSKSITNIMNNLDLEKLTDFSTKIASCVFNNEKIDYDYDYILNFFNEAFEKYGMECVHQKLDDIRILYK